MLSRPGACLVRQLIHLRGPADFSKHFKADLLVQIGRQKYFRFHQTQITGLISAIPFRKRGHWPSSLTLGRVAVDARRRRALFARGRTTPKPGEAFRRRRAVAYGEVVWS